MGKPERYGEPWTPEEDKQLKKLYPTHSKTQIAAILQRPQDAVKSRANRLKLKRTPEQSAALMRKIPNKGQFQRGHVPLNTFRDGCISIRGDGGRNTTRKIYYIRTEKGKWEQLHHYLWENVFGPIPVKAVLGFKDGNTLNCNLYNLYLIKMGDNMKRNSASLNYKDGWVAQSLIGSRKMKESPELYDAIKSNKPLIEAKRAQLQLKRTIKQK